MKTYEYSASFKFSELSAPKLTIIMIIKTVIGFAMLVGAVVLFVNTQAFLKNAINADGTVIELIETRSSRSRSRTSYKPRVEYITQDGLTREFIPFVSSNPSFYHKGQSVQISYQDSFPYRARINNFFSLWGMPTILGSIGLVLFIIGLLGILLRILNNKKGEDLRKNGVPIKAKIQNVEINSSIEVQGEHPYKIRAQWQNPNTSEVHMFLSENIWFNPTNYLNYKDTDEVTVLIERDNPKKYCVDISFLPLDIYS